MHYKYKNLRDFILEEKIAVFFSVFIAIIGVAGGLFPYFIIYKILKLLFLKQATEALVVQYSLWALGGFVIQLLGHYISTIISHKTAFKILEKMRVIISEKMLRLPLGTIQKKGNGYFKNLMIDEIERLEYPLAHVIPELTSSLVLPISIIIFAFIMDWRIGLAIFVPVFVTLIIYFPMYTGIMRKFENTYYSAIENMNSRVIEYITGIKEIKIFGRAKDKYSTFEDAIDQYESSTLKLYNKMYFVSSPAFVLLSSIMASVIIVGGVLFTYGKLNFEVYLFAMIISVGIGVPILKFLEFMDNVLHIKIGSRLLVDVLDLPELKVNTKEVHSLNSKDIVMQDVSFAYDNIKVLNNINVTFKENQKTALVGSSGSGKSTIANLLARFWDPTQGSVSIGGIDYKDISLEQLMENINYVTQESFLFNQSIKDNIRLGKQDASDEEVFEAAKKALCDEFILEFENGYDTIVGNMGAKLSGGQRQRIIIARAILRNAPILILDEATAFADMENQLKLQEAINTLCKNKTLIVIAHRLATISQCDKIVVVNDGKIENIGTHKELLKNSEIYRNLWTIFMRNNSTELITGKEANNV